MAYRKKINSEQRRLRELAKALTESPQRIQPSQLNSKEERKTNIKLSTGTEFSIKPDILKILFSALVILGLQVGLSLTIF